MANEQLYATVSDQRTATMLSRIILLSLAARGTIPAHPALIFGGDTAKTGTDTLQIPQVGLMGYDLLTSVADGSSVGNTAITDASSSLLPAGFRKSYELSDKAKWTDPSTGMLNASTFAQDAVNSFQATMLSELSQMGAGFSTFSGSTGVDLAIADHLAARITLEIANVAGPYLAVYHGRQEGDLVTAAATATGGAIQWRDETQTLIGATGAGGRGTYLGVDVTVSNHVPAINSGADRGGFMFGRGAIVWGMLSPTAEGPDQVALGPVLFERERDAKGGLTAYVTHAYLDFAEAIDLAGTGVRTDA
jgi:hypothetical protein